MARTVYPREAAPFAFGSVVWQPFGKTGLRLISRPVFAQGLDCASPEQITGGLAFENVFKDLAVQRGANEC